jgi:Domain of unknown function (DUF4149)
MARRHVWRAAAVTASLWAGVLLCIGAIATPAAFATLPIADAGNFVRRVFQQEAYISIAVALVLFVIERQRSRDESEAGTGSVMSTNILILFGTLFCTVAGYFAVQPLMEAAKAGQGSVSFGALHGISSSFFLIKGVLVLVLCWRLSSSAPSAVG